MQWFSAGGIFYIIDNIILPLASTFLLLFFLLFLIRLIKKDQVDIFYKPKFMSPKDAKSYLKQVKRKKIEKEFDTLVQYGKLNDSHKNEFIKLREENMGIKEVIEKLNPQDEQD